MFNLLLLSTMILLKITNPSVPIKLSRTEGFLMWEGKIS